MEWRTQWWIQILKQLGEDRNTLPVPNIIRGHRPEIFFLLVLQTSVWPKIRRKLQLTPTFPPYRPLLRFPTGTLGKITLKASWEFPIKICRDHGIERPFFRDYGIEDLYCFSRQSDLSSNTDEFYSRSRLWTIRDFKIQRRGRQRERQKTIGLRWFPGFALRISYCA